MAGFCVAAIKLGVQQDEANSLTDWPMFVIYEETLRPKWTVL
jgi:hypothetical protein